MRYAVSFLSLISVLILLACSGDVQRRQLFFKMDTATEVILSVPRSFDVGPVWRSIDSLLSISERHFSVTNERSQIKGLNERRENALPVPPELGEMLKMGIAYGDTLDGSFDITVLPLKEIWGFCEDCTGNEPLPDSARIRAAVQKVDYRKVRVNETGDSIFFESGGIVVDAGGIAKGYVLKQAAQLLRDRGITNYLISAGGDILISGRKQNKTPWRVGVQHPRNRSELITALHLESGALVTSGDYERYRLIDNHRYHHIFNPHTGHPCHTNQSLTIWTLNPIRADILSTGLFCWPTDKILEFVIARDDLECLIVDSSGTIHTSNENFWF